MGQTVLSKAQFKSSGREQNRSDDRGNTEILFYGYKISKKN